jgi:hypothetical protein
VTPAIAVAPLLVAITLAATGCSRAVVMSTPFSPVAP